MMQPGGDDEEVFGGRGRFASEAEDVDVLTGIGGGRKGIGRDRLHGR